VLGNRILGFLENLIFFVACPRRCPTLAATASRTNGNLRNFPWAFSTANVIILKGSGLDESNIQPLLSALDDEFLPDVDLEHGNLTYTVVLGEVLGNWEAEKPTTAA
jgi:hypothetical protein